MIFLKEILYTAAVLVIYFAIGDGVLNRLEDWLFDFSLGHDGNDVFGSGRALWCLVWPVAILYAIALKRRRAQTR